MHRLAFGFALVVAAALTAACPPAVPPGVAYVRVAPPPLVSEVMVASPGPDFVWVRGYHRWDGATYLWVPGSWQRPPRTHAVWVAGRWRHHRNGWYWVEGRWK